MAINTLRELVTRSAAETEAAGERLGRTLAVGDLLLLAGELGAGKTTFVRGLARGLAVKGAVQSPTFQLVRVHPGPIPLAHVDLYRLETSGELGDLGLEEMLDEGVVVVEWGSRLLKPPGRHGRVDFDLLDPASRSLRLEGPAEWSL